jgi:hypothetical protein
MSSTDCDSQNMSAFIGSWCNHDKTEESGEYIYLSFAFNDQRILESSFSNGGPFEEVYLVKPNNEKKSQLFFNSIGGSIAFNNLQNNESDLCKKSALAVCEILDSTHMSLTTYINDCSYLPESITVILHKLEDGDFCGE